MWYDTITIIKVDQKLSDIFREIILKPSINLRKVFDRHLFWNLKLVSLAKSTSALAKSTLALPKLSRPKSPSSM